MKYKTSKPRPHKQSNCCILLILFAPPRSWPNASVTVTMPANDLMFGVWRNVSHAGWIRRRRRSGRSRRRRRTEHPSLVTRVRPGSAPPLCRERHPALAAIFGAIGQRIAGRLPAPGVTRGLATWSGAGEGRGGGGAQVPL